jgi:hypothetical protein
MTGVAIHHGKQAFFEDVLGGILRRAKLELRPKDTVAYREVVEP